MSPKKHSLSILWYDHHMILAVPLHVGLTPPILHGDPPGPLDRAFLKEDRRFFAPEIHSGNGRASPILTARGGGLRRSEFVYGNRSENDLIEVMI